MSSSLSLPSMDMMMAPAATAAAMYGLDAFVLSSVMPMASYGALALVAYGGWGMDTLAGLADSTGASKRIEAKHLYVAIAYSLLHNMGGDVLSLNPGLISARGFVLSAALGVAAALAGDQLAGALKQ